jgi:hypothetical protein
MSETASLFSQNRYILFRSLVDAHQARELYQHALDLVNAGEMSTDPQLPDTPSLYAEPRTEQPLVTLQARIERISGLSLYPTYSYLRVYKHGNVLAKHRDRASCEISISLALGYKADACWPLWIEGPGGVSTVQMEPGDGLLYRGTECFHWREAFSGDHAALIFLHYVDQNGPSVEWKLDKRAGPNLDLEFAASWAGPCRFAATRSLRISAAGIGVLRS